MCMGRREWRPTPVFLPGKSHGQRSLGATVHGVTKSGTWLTNTHTHTHTYTHTHTHSVCGWESEKSPVFKTDVIEQLSLMHSPIRLSSHGEFQPIVLAPRTLQPHSCALFDRNLVDFWIPVLSCVISGPQSNLASLERNWWWVWENPLRLLALPGHPSLEKFSTVFCNPHNQRLLEFSFFFFYNIVYIGNLISGSSAFSKSILYIWNFSVHILLKPSLENFEHYFATMWNECNCALLWTFFETALLWD